MKVLMVSLGCDKNLVDAEEMLGLLDGAGFEITDDETEAEVAVLNSCCFIESAKKESIEHIIELGELKETGKLKALVVTGCMAQRYKEEILTEMPEVDAIVGTTGRAQIVEAIRTALEGQRLSFLLDASKDPEIKQRRLVSTGGHYAFLRIAEGCDKKCTYCAIPSFRGSYRSVPREALLDEAKALARDGVTELILVAQETTRYGVDLYGRKCLHELLKDLAAIPELHWIRILYAYPEEIYPELIDVMASEKKICRYLDLPIQHASDAVLRRMNRATRREELTALIDTLRRRLPGIFLRTTLISGFPGETEEDHRELLDFVEKERFDRLGVFTYSREEGTPAEKMKPQVKKSVANARRREIMAAQQKISLARGKSRIGTVMECVIEGELPEDHVFQGRCYGDAPGVDGLVFISSERILSSGDFVMVRITGASEYDMTGVCIDEEYESAE